MQIDFKDQQDIIEYATRYVESCLEKRDWKIEEPENELKQIFRDNIQYSLSRRQAKGLRTDGIICTFHAKLISEEKELKIKDVDEFIQDRDDYEEMIAINYYKCKQTNPNYLWILITDKRFNPDIKKIKEEIESGNICLIRSGINTKYLMYERVKLYYLLSIVVSSSCKIALIDGDAFIMKNIERIWNVNSDIILTKRCQSVANNIVPINEGVILCKKGDASKQFFRDYITAYQILAKDKILENYYQKTIKRWRGGQLALNVIRNLAYSNHSKRYRIEELPCHKFNCFPKIYNPIDTNKKYIIHIKGKSKDFDVIKKTLS